MRSREFHLVPVVHKSMYNMLKVYKEISFITSGADILAAFRISIFSLLIHCKVPATQTSSESFFFAFFYII
jgi:hypothetical protein